MTKAVETVVGQERSKNQPVDTGIEVAVSFGSDPTGADVVVDGVYLGATPLDVPHQGRNPSHHDW